MKLDLSIDKNALDTEWEKQAEQMHYWCSVRADAQLQADEAKDALAVTEADLAQRVRADPVEFGVAKPTEDAVKQAVAAHVEREVAASRYYKAKHAVAVCEAAVQGLEHRKRALTCLVDLFLASYYSGTGNRGTAHSTNRAKGVRNDDDE